MHFYTSFKNNRLENVQIYTTFVVYKEDLLGVVLLCCELLHLSNSVGQRPDNLQQTEHFSHVSFRVWSENYCFVFKKKIYTGISVALGCWGHGRDSLQYAASTPALTNPVLQTRPSGLNWDLQQVRVGQWVLGNTWFHNKLGLDQIHFVLFDTKRRKQCTDKNAELLHKK